MDIMSSERTSDGFEFSCDKCGEVHKPPRLGRGSDGRSWHEAWELAKADGWRAIKVRSGTGKDEWEWEHACRECS